MTATPDPVTEARHFRDTARQAVTSTRAGLATAEAAQNDYLKRFDSGLSTSPGGLRDRADAVEHARRLIGPAERAAEAAERAYRMAVAVHLAYVIQSDDRTNGEGLRTARETVAGHLAAALEAATSFYGGRNAAVAEAHELGRDADLPTATVDQGIQSWMRNVSVDDPLATVWRLANGTGYAVETGDMPGVTRGIAAMETVASSEAAARALIAEILEGLAA